MRCSGVCVDCQRYQVWYSKGRAGRVDTRGWCDRCGTSLAMPGTREYRAVAIAAWGSLRVGHIRATARPQVRSPWTKPAMQFQLDAIAAERVAEMARELAHEARSVFVHLRFDFDVDVDGRVVWDSDAGVVSLRSSAA